MHYAGELTNFGGAVGPAVPPGYASKPTMATMSSMGTRLTSHSVPDLHSDARRMDAEINRLAAFDAKSVPRLMVRGWER